MKNEYKNTYNLLNEYNPEDKWEQECKLRMLNFIKYGNDCFSRNNQFGHFTASAFLLNKSMDSALLMHHSKLDIWVQPGGHCDSSSDILSVSIREAQEESGIQNVKAIFSNIFDIDIHTVPANSSEGQHFHFDIRFLIHAYVSDNLIKNHESKELRWVNKNLQNMPTKSDSVMRMFRKYFKFTI